ncbi:MAG: helix-turn-helix domain-containing protein [Treponemataceae bacterium]
MFWENVEKLRKIQKTSYRWLSEKMNIPETTLSSMRSNKTEPRATESIKIAKALNTTVEYLVTGVDTTEQDKLKSVLCDMQKVLDRYKNL